jgi:YHS domain-containing protein
MAIDLVCHMEVNEKTVQWASDYKGQTYYFCAPGCKASFEKDPENYLGQTDERHHHHQHH